MIILVTLGTGHEEPEPPDFLVEYFELLETYGFSKTVIRTDYQFQSLEEAEELTMFFWGNELADKVHEGGLTIVEECTGIWWLKV